MPRLLIQSLRRNAWRHALSSLGVAAGIAALTFFVSLGLGAGRALLEVLSRSLPIDVVEVTPKDAGLGLLSLAGAPVVGGGMTDDTIEKISGIPGVSSVAPEMPVMAPLQAYGTLFGRRVVTDLAATGLDPKAVAGDIAPGLSFSYSPDGPVPVIVSTGLLELYNRSISPSMGLPRISASMASNVDFNLVVGRSFLGGTPDQSKVREYRCRVVGVSPRAMLIGMTVPLEYAKRWNAEFRRSGPAAYRAAYVTIGRTSDLSRINAEIEAMGLDVDALRRTAGGLMKTAATAMAALFALMTAAAAAGSSHALGTSVHERRREIGVLRSAGATRGGVVSLIVGEAAVVGAVAGIAGVAAGWLLSAAADASLAVLLPPFPFKPEHFFAWSPAAGLAAVLLSTVFCAAGGVVPAVRAARMDPAEALRS